jgi:hypothetical protein
MNQIHVVTPRRRIIQKKSCQIMMHGNLLFQKDDFIRPGETSIEDYYATELSFRMKFYSQPLSKGESASFYLPIDQDPDPLRLFRSLDQSREIYFS